jgi:hypothetical protein
MAKFVLLNTRIYAGPADLTGNGNRVELGCEFPEKDATNWASGGAKELVGGVFSTSISAGGQIDASSTNPHGADPTSWDNMTARRAQAWTFAPDTVGVGDLAWFTMALRGSYKLGGQVGDIAPWEAKAAGTSPLLRGVVAHPPGTPRTAAGSGTGLNLGPLSAAQRMYAALHVLSIAGTGPPTITARVESSADNTFASPTTRLTFPAASFSPLEPRGMVLSADGPTADAWWRVAWTVTGTTPSFLFLAALGIA